ncbi:MAG: hypothetical protein ACQEWV_30300 [Bacillota bacterium]
MRKIIFFTMLTLILLTGCSGPVKTEIADSIENKLNEDKEIAKYITDSIQITHSTSAQSGGYKYINFDVNSEVNSNFINLSDEEKNDVLSKMASIIEKNTDFGFDFDCGDKKICAFNDIELTNNKDTYSYESLDLDGDLIMNHNGEEVYPLEEETVTTTPSESDDIQSNSNPTLDKEAIHAFMEYQYNEITNYGDSYEPEIHDPMVAKLASERFNISEEEAGQIFIEISMQQ